MPELPEIETIRRDLEKALKGDHSVRVEVFDIRLMKKADIAKWNTVLAGQPWQHFTRKGKYLAVELANGWRVGFHMRMTGQLMGLASTTACTSMATLSPRKSNGSRRAATFLRCPANP